MDRFKNLFAMYLAVGLMIFGVVGQADAQRRNEREVRDIVRNLNSQIDDFEYGLNYQLRNSSANRQDMDDVTNDLRNLQGKISAFETNLDRRRENRDDVSEIIAASKNIDEFMSRNPQNRKIEDNWKGIHNLLDRLAASYGVGIGSNNEPGLPDDDSNQNNYPTQNYPAQTRSVSYGLTGTYQLDPSKSESTDQIISETNVGEEQRQDLEDKLSAPEQIALDIRGSQVTLATTNASPVTFTADGREKTEQSNGRTVRVRATLNGQVLTVSSLGGDTDYTITFSSTDNGKTLKVTRRITTDYLNQTVFAESVYNKTDSIAKLGIDPNQNVPDNGTYSTNDPNDRGNPNSGPTVNSGRRGEYVVPNGTIVTAVLDSDINTKASQNNDRFRMTVQSPDEFRGATIEGYISGVGRSGKVTGRSNVTFNFERITLRNGQTYDFAGFLQSVKDHQGKTVKVDTEGAAKGESQTKETAKRGGIGAGIGAVIGAIAGGVKGAAIGAIIGGGAGAGSVVVQGKEDLELLKGSTITVQASSPNK